MVFEGGELAVKLQAKDVEVGTSLNGNTRKDQVTIGIFHSPGSTNNYTFGFVMIQYRAPVIAPLLNPSQVPVKGGIKSRSVCYLVNNC